MAAPTVGLRRALAPVSSNIPRTATHP